MDIEFRVLGPLQVIVDGKPVHLGGKRPRALLGVLLTTARRPVTPEHLIDQLWGEDPPPTATTALHVHVSALRKLLGADRLLTTKAGYVLHVEPDEVDAERFQADPSNYLALWRGEPFGGVPSVPDVDAARRRLTELRLSTLESRFERELNAARHSDVIAELAELTETFPDRERLAGQLMLALYRSGRIDEARAAYHRLERHLGDVLGVQPGNEIQALASAIGRRDPTLDPPSAIPVPPSRFIGRRAELEQLADRLGTSRLLTLTGPGGVGKTRMALELARDTEAGYRDGVYVVELAPVAPDDPVENHLAAALAVRVTELENRLRTARTLVVLDNCEHIVKRCAQLADELLRTCVGLRIIATSREPLGVAGEQVWQVEGLPARDAIRLLLDRGTSVRTDFVLDSRTVPLANRLCTRLGGLPLAIELAAAQLRSLSLREISTGLDPGLDLRDRLSRTTPPRHQTMRAAIDSSYRLLSDAEQATFRRLGVFAGDCEVTAAILVTHGSADVLERLVDRSLIAPVRPGAQRIRMLELIREYARERLEESGEVKQTRDRHAEWCAELAESAMQSGPDAAMWMNRLRAEAADLRAAVAWCLREHDHTRALRIVVSLWWFWWQQGLMAIALGWLRDAMVDPDEIPDALYARALRVRATLARNSGDHREAREFGERALEAYHTMGDIANVAISLNGLCITALAEGDPEASRQFAVQCRSTAEQAGDQLHVAAAVNNLGLALRGLDRLADARAAFSEARERFEALDDRRGVAAALSNLATVARRLWDLRISEEFALASLAIYHDLHFTEGELDAVGAMAMLALADGMPDQALRLLEVVERERARLGTPLFVPDEVAEHDAAISRARAEAGARRFPDASLDEVVAELLGPGKGLDRS